jgi:hypothetical protein
MTAKFWNVPATLSWIATGDEALSEELQAIPNASSQDLSGKLGWHVIRKLRQEHPELKMLLRRLRSFEKLSNHPNTKEILFKPPPIKELECSLFAALVSGKVKSSAVKDWKGNRVAICADDWDGLAFTDDQSGIIAQPSNRLAGRNLTLSDIRISVADTKGTWHFTEEAETKVPATDAKLSNKDLWCKEALKLLDAGHPPDKAKLSRKIRDDHNVHQQPGTIEKAIRAAVNQWESRNPIPGKKPENPRTAIRD